ncbi:Uncharacterized protein LSUE1_G008790 [Lachnellula suecica]|uniref:A-kinase anchor protein 7-like phosphoesterase domain-containing protein n=1 Tax=Lachnellula suecica TaxID=602035 RepID=A0A8T9BV47_9HELO|nr:Uncharacterized protein LSUE1_G008790 [Lachnellula suecica]
MSLLTPERISLAISLLQSLDLKTMLHSAFQSESKSKETGETKLGITLKGLSSMHNPSSTSILYAPPLPSKPLEDFCKALKDVFLSEGLLVVEDRELLLHATVLNTVYVKGGRRGGGGHGKRKARLTVDASALLAEWTGFVWCEGAVERVAVCRMGAEKDGDGEVAYGEVGSVALP